MSVSNMLTLKDWNYRTLIMDILNLEENNLDSKKKLSMKEKTSPIRDTQMRKYSWIGWDEESSRTTSWRILSTEITRKSRDTIQRLTSQLQSIQEQMNSMSDSGEFEEVESNHSGRLSSRSQSTRSDSMFFLYAEPRQNACHLIHGISPGLQEKRFFSNQFFYTWFARKSLSRN